MVTMDPIRKDALERGLTMLTEDELRAGWHFCYDWDGMLIHVSHPEIEGCNCGYHQFYPV